MNGLEMMLGNLLNSIGIDPQEIMDKANKLIETLERFEQRVARIETALGIMTESEAKQIQAQEVTANDNAIADALAENVK